MALAEVHSWARFIAGMLAGCWIGALVACGGILLLVGRRVHQLEAMNLLLRTRLRARSLPPRGGAGEPSLVMPLPGPERPISRIAGMN